MASQPISVIDKMGISDEPVLTLRELQTWRSGDDLYRLTPEGCKRLLEQVTYEYQRAIRPRHVAVLVQEMASGRWLSASNEIEFCEVRKAGGGGYDYILVNGYHRMHAVIEWGKALCARVNVVKCNHMDEVHRVYGVHDTHGIRTMGDFLPSSKLREATLDYATTKVKYLVAAVRVIQNDFDLPSRGSSLGSNEEMTNALAWVEEFKLYDKWVADRQDLLSTKIWKRSPMSVALVTVSDQPEKAEKFWRAVAMMKGDGKDDPILKTATTLIEAKVDGRRETAALCRKIANCWNAYYGGYRLQLVRGVWDDPIRIDGTRFKYGHAKK